MHVPIVFSCIQPYLPFQLSSFFFIYSSHEDCPFRLLQWSFQQNRPQLQAFPSPRLLYGCHHSCLLRPTCFFTVHLRECPSPTLQSWGSLPSFLHVFFFSAACLLFSLGGYADLAQGCLWDYRMPLSLPRGAGVW
jgi:hypothetical protein